jgi:hypothetical protein
VVFRSDHILWRKEKVKKCGEGKRMASSSGEWFLAIFPIRMKLSHPSISTGQGNQFISLLPSALEPLKSPRDNKIREVLKRYAHTTQ